MTRGAIWSQVSTAERATANQLEVLRELAQRRGLEVVREYTLEGESAFNGAHKRELARLLADAHRGSFEVVLVWALDRLSRARRHGGVVEASTRTPTIHRRLPRHG